MAIFTGAGVAIVTPMKKGGEVNFEKLGELIDFQIENSTDCIVICGTTGESSTLSHEEHIACIKYAVEKTNKRVPVVAGTGSNSTDEAIYLSTQAEKCGVDGLLIVTPYYNKATQKGLINYFTDIANAVSIPLILYNVPGRTGCNIAPETAATLAKEVKNIVAIKEASGDISQIAKLARLTRGTLDIYTGNDDQIAATMALGGIGVISVFSNVAPKQAHDICASYLNGNPEECTKLQLDALDVINDLFIEVNPIPVKAALNLMGLDVGSLRKPLTEMEDHNLAKLEASMKAYGLI